MSAGRLSGLIGKLFMHTMNLKPRTSPSILFVWREKMPFKLKFIGNLVLLDNVITEPSIYPQEPWLLVASPIGITASS